MSVRVCIFVPEIVIKEHERLRFDFHINVHQFTHQNEIVAAAFSKDLVHKTLSNFVVKSCGK
jgi:hypothetical protein